MTYGLTGRSFRGTLGILCVLFLALPFAVYAVQKGFRFTDVQERATSRFFDSDAVMVSAALYFHMVSGGIITVLAPLQMSRVLRSRWPKVHHVCGYLTAGLALCTSSAGLFYILVQGTIGGSVMSTGFAIYGALMGIAAIQTVHYARRRHAFHYLWAGRLIILALASWFYRVHYGIWEIATGGIGSRPDFSGPFDQFRVFAFYLPYLILHHFWWHMKHRAA